MGLSEPARGIVPSFVSTPEFGDLRMDSALAAFGQLRHAHVLVTGEAFAESGCLIPTGYVEPAPAALDRLALAADEAARVFDVPNLRVPEQTRPTVEAFQRMAQTFRVLRAIVGHELEGRPLTDGENLYLAQVVEGRPVNPYMMQREHLDGWYYRMFQNLRSARRPAAFVADYFFAPDTGTAAYVGGDQPRIGVFVVDTGGQPRVVVGPVAHAYERHERGARLSDQSDAPPPKMLSRWSKSYEVGVQPEVGILDIGRGPEPGAFIVKPRGLAPAALGHVRVEEVDIHDHPCSGVDVTLGKAPVRFVLPDAVCERPDNGRAFRLRKNGIVLTDSTLAESASTARSASELD
jgi:hypothetical protein